jgi:ADP-ribose pyrophosphatase YjhB (NUDIX family)
MQQFHEGVGLLVSNFNNNRFFVQIKDNSYSVPKWRGCCSFWGGAVESDDPSFEAAVWRELKEEIPHSLQYITTIQSINRYLVCSGATQFGLNLFVSYSSDAALDKIAKGPVLEGLGRIMSLEELLAHKWIFDMNFIFESYLDQKK